MHHPNILLRVEDDIFEVKNRVGFDQGISDHELYGLACLMEVNLTEEFKTAIKDQVYISCDLRVVCHFVVDYRRIVNDTLVVYLCTIYSSMLQVSIQVIELIEVERITFV